MKLPSQKNQLAKIFVQGHQDSLFLERLQQNRLITWIGKNISRPENIVPQGTQRLDSTTPNTRIQQQLQAATGAGKTVSDPTVARAYSKQAKISSRCSQG